MAKYLFSKRSDVEALLEIVAKQEPRRMPSSGVRREGVLTTGWLFKTPLGGIPARDSVSVGEPGYADCDAFYITSIDELDEFGEPTGKKLPRIAPAMDDFDNAIVLEVLNVFSTPIAEFTYITCKEIHRRLVVDAEDCPVGGAAPAAPPPGGLVI